ncbi:N-6 DNA methylase (plasmid) [Leifsonia sp. P73]
MSLLDVSDTSELRKARGAFFTPQPLTRFIAEWAVRTPADQVMEPSAGDAAFLVEAVRRLVELGVAAPPLPVSRSMSTALASRANASPTLAVLPTSPTATFSWSILPPGTTR